MVLRYKMLKIPLSLKFKAHKHAFLWLQENQEVIKNHPTHPTDVRMLLPLTSVRRATLQNIAIFLITRFLTMSFCGFKYTQSHLKPSRHYIISSLIYL